MKVKKIIKIVLWGYIIINVAPEACHTIMDCTGTIVSEGFKWCGRQMWDGFIERGTVHGVDEDKAVGGILGKILGLHPDDLPTEGPGVGEGTAKINEWINNLLKGSKNKDATSMLDKLLKNNELDPTSATMAKELIEQGYTVVREK